MIRPDGGHNCAVCGEPATHLCDEHGGRCPKHLASHAFCGKLDAHGCICHFEAGERYANGACLSFHTVPAVGYVRLDGTLFKGRWDQDPDFMKPAPARSS